jgi:hypothetical protein
MILSAVARILEYPIIKQLEEDSADADRIGISGTNTYLCNNYTSPLHCDNDAGTGLCAQYELQALSALDEYAFTHGDYGVYMVTRRNSLWYDFLLICYMRFIFLKIKGHLMVRGHMELCFRLPSLFDQQTRRFLQSHV